ncbi:MAG: YcaO-like family protein, partial [Roseobacter sp.]
MTGARQDPDYTDSFDVSTLIECLSQETAKVFLKGGRRGIMPEQTLSRLMPLLQVVGITRIANVTGLDRIGIPVINVCRPNSRSLAVYQGKGATLASAKASGLMESFERYHAEFCGPPQLSESYANLQTQASTVDVENLPLRKGASFQAGQSRGWLQGVNLLNKQLVWVPYEIVHFD